MIFTFNESRHDSFSMNLVMIRFPWVLLMILTGPQKLLPLISVENLTKVVFSEVYWRFTGV